MLRRHSQLKISFLIFFIHLLVANVAFAQSPTWTDTAYEATIPLVENEVVLGEVKSSIQGDHLLWVDRDSLTSVLSSKITKEVLKKIESEGKTISPARLPFKLTFNPVEARLELTPDISQKESVSTNLREDYDNQYGGKALAPAPFGGAINYRLEQSYAADRLGGSYFNGQFNSFINMNSLVFENQSIYQSDLSNNWFRGDTRLVKDFEKAQIRTQAGDIYPQVQGFMQSRPLGGISIARNFSLNPYRVPYPTGTQNFTLQARSLVKYFVNSSLIKTEYLPAGNYTAKDIPLNNGLNTILIEATDDLGQKQYFTFRSAASITLLNEGESRFDLSYGTPFSDEKFKRVYRSEEKELFSGFFQYGFSSSFSASAYLQNQDQTSLAGTEVIEATRIGNITFGHAQSRQSTLNGFANSVGYQYVTQGQKWYQTHTLGMRYENRSEDFRTSTFDTKSAVQNNYSASYTLPVASLMTASVGGSYGDVRNNKLADRYGFDTTLNFRIMNHHNISFFVGRNRDENKVWNDVAYAFLTITFPETNNFVSALYDQQQKSTKVTYIRDNQNRLYTPRAIGSVENSPTRNAGEVDLTYPTPFGDIGGRIHSDNNFANKDYDTRTSARFNSAFVFAYNDGNFGAGISRPVPNSFVILKQDDSMKGQKVGLKSTSPYTEAESGLFNEIVFSNLLAYQYRDIQLDPTMMDEGRTLVQDNFTIYPTYRSAHLIVLKETGRTMLKGRIVQADGSPLALEVGMIGEKSFFTNRNGEFFVEGIDPGLYDLKLEGKPGTEKISISAEMKGIQDIGQIILKEEEP
jgi:outer membrane usher protein